MSDVLFYIVTGGVFIGGMVPLVSGIISLLKENKQLDKAKKKTTKGKEYAV